MTRDQNDPPRPNEFFEDVLVPLAATMRAQGKLFFALGPDAASQTYFETPARPVMRRGDFEFCAAESLEDFVEELAAMWTAEGHLELAAIAPNLLDLYEPVGEESAEEEISPFIYAMF